MPGMPALPPATPGQSNIPSTLRPSGPGLPPPLPAAAPTSKLPEPVSGNQQTKYPGPGNDKKTSEGVSLFGSRVDPGSAK